jgi:hypothetical protein
MKHRAATVLALALLAGPTAAGCSSATAGTVAASSTAAKSAPASSASASSASPSAGTAVAGPVSDPGCVAAKAAEATLIARQTKDQSNETALDKDFTNFANALNNAAGKEQNQAIAQVITTLANDYTALVQSQSGAQQLPDMTTVQNDGAAFDKAC